MLSEYLLLANMLINWLSLLVRVFTENQTCCFQTDFTIFEVELSAKKSSIVPGNVELSGVLCGFLVGFFVVFCFCFDVFLKRRVCAVVELYFHCSRKKLEIADLRFE